MGSVCVSRKLYMVVKCIDSVVRETRINDRKIDAGAGGGVCGSSRVTVRH